MKHPRLQLNKRAFWCGVAVLVLLRCGLTGFQQAYTWVGGAPLDDELMFRAAQAITAGEWLGAYDYLTLSKAMFFPVWLALLHVLHLPYLVSGAALWCAASLLAAFAFAPLWRNAEPGCGRVLTLGLFGALAFLPSGWAAYTLRVYRDNIFPALCLVFFAGMAGMALRAVFYTAKQKPLWPWLLAAGVGLACAYLDREDAGMFLLDSPVSGGNPMAIAGTLAIMTGGDKEAFDKVKPVLECMGSPVYTGGPASGSVTKLVNNMIGGAILVAIAEGYAFAAKAGIDLQTTFEATRGGFAGGPMYDNKVPKIIKRDYTPGARIAVHRKDILNAKHYAHKLDIDTPLTDVVLHVMDWMNDNGHIDEDQAALVKYYEDKMGVKVGREETAD